MEGDLLLLGVDGLEELEMVKFSALGFIFDAMLSVSPSLKDCKVALVDCGI